MPVTRRFGRDPAAPALIRYTASCVGEPTFQVQTVLADRSGEDADPQTSLHADTFHASAKAWLFRDGVGKMTGPSRMFWPPTA